MTALDPATAHRIRVLKETVTDLRTVVLDLAEKVQVLIDLHPKPENVNREILNRATLGFGDPT